MMRAAAKVAGFGVVNTGLRGGVVPESPISAAARAAARPVGVISAKSSSDGLKASVAIDDGPPSVERTGWVEIDDWDFAGSEEEIFAPAGDPPLRLVFGGAPTVEEAKEATTELKDALEKVFVSSPKSSGSESLHGASHSVGLLQLSNSEVLEKKALTSSYSTPNHAIQAFKFLDQSPEVQGVVASIASDPTVWDAVLQNPALQSYLQSHGTAYSKLNLYQNVGESTPQGDVLYQECPKSFDVSSSESGKADDDDCNAGESSSKNELLNIWENIKLRVVDMMSNLSDFFSSLFGVQQGDIKAGANTGPFPAAVEKFLGPSLMAVVVMVIMVVVLKRA